MDKSYKETFIKEVGGDYQAVVNSLRLTAEHEGPWWGGYEKYANYYHEKYKAQRTLRLLGEPFMDRQPLGSGKVPVEFKEWAVTPNFVTEYTGQRRASNEVWQRDHRQKMAEWERIRSIAQSVLKKS
jgi:hypothetical protein